MSERLDTILTVFLALAAILTCGVLLFVMWPLFVLGAVIALLVGIKSIRIRQKARSARISS